MSVISGIAKKFDGTAIDYVSIFNWDDGKCIAQIVPNASGEWSYNYSYTLHIGITYVSDGCKPITHGSYYFEFLSSDEYAGNVVAMLYFDGDIVDETGKVWTPNGNAQIDEGQSVLGGGSLLLDGNGDYITSPIHADFGFGVEDFTVEGFFRKTGENINGFLADFRVVAGASFVVWCSQTNNRNRLGYSNEIGTGFVVGATTFPLNIWTHWAVSREAGVVRGFMGGVLQFITTDARDLSSPQGVYIGSSTSANQGAVGNIDELRITKGVARYVDSFEPPRTLKDVPTEDFGDPYADNVVALLHFDGNLTDETGIIWSANNNPAYDTGVFNNAIKLQSSSKQCVYASNGIADFSYSDFTVEFFINFQSFNAEACVLTGGWNYSAGKRTWGFLLGAGSASNQLHFYCSSNGSSSYICSIITSGLSVNTTYHVAAVREGSTFRLFLNGTLVGTSTSNASIYSDLSSGVTVGSYSQSETNSSYYVDAWFDELRITKGIARYFDSFEPPQTSNDVPTQGFRDPYADKVVALLHFDEEISDASGNCSFETLGNISYEDGVFNKALEFTPISSSSRNGLLENIVNNPVLSLGADDFTIEFFVNPSASYKQNDQVLLSLFEVSNFAGWQVFLSGMKLAMYKYDSGGNTFLTSSTALIPDKWYYVAYCRLNGITSLYVDGIADVTAHDNTKYSTTGIKLSIGYQEHGNARYPFTGMLDEIRITKGVARYTENFTPPTEPFTL